MYLVTYVEGMKVGLVSAVLGLAKAHGPREVRGALREALAVADEPAHAARTALRSMGIDLVATTYTANDLRAPVLILGREVILVERAQEVPFAEVASAAGFAGASEIPAAIAIPRRPLQGLAGRSKWGRVLALLDLERADLLVVFVFAAALGLTTLATPIAVQALFDVVAFGTLLQPLVVVALLLMAVLIFAGLMRILETVAIELIARRVFVRAATDFAHRIPMIDRSTISAPDLRQKVTRFLDAVVVEKSLSVILFDGTTSVLQIGAGLLLLAFYHPILLAFDAVLVIGLGIVIVAAGRNGIATAVRESKLKYRIADWLGELASAPNAFGSWTGLDFAEARADDFLGEWLTARRAQFRVQLRQLGGMLTLQIGASVGLLLIGGGLVIDRQLSLGQLVAAELVMTATVSSMTKLGKIFAKVYDLIAGLGKLGEVIDLDIVDPSGTRLGAGPAVGLELPGVVAAPGERVAVLGGPSALAERLGRLRVDDLAADGLEPADLREHVLLLSNEEVFGGDLVDNLIVRHAGLTQLKARDVLESIGVVAAERGFAEDLGAQGSRLSRDDRARLLLARALLAPARAVIFDRVFDGLSERTLHEIQRELPRIGTATVVCLTERPEVAALFDRTIPLDTIGEAA